MQIWTRRDVSAVLPGEAVSDKVRTGDHWDHQIHPSALHQDTQLCPAYPWEAAAFQVYIPGRCSMEPQNRYGQKRAPRPSGPTGFADVCDKTQRKESPCCSQELCPAHSADLKHQPWLWSRAGEEIPAGDGMRAGLFNIDGDGMRLLS